MKLVARIACVAAAALLAAGLLAAMAGLPPAGVRLSQAVASHLAQSGTEHPVTAVLLNFRGYDTLLEVVVLLLALLGVAAVRTPPEREPAGRSGEPVVQTLARAAAPLLVLAAVYLLWAGAHRPGGAFQAAAVLAAAAVLLNLAGVLPGWGAAGAVLRLGFVAGLIVFVAVAAPPSGGGSLLQYPPARAGALILLVEGGLAVSLGLVLAALFLWLSEHRDEEA
jgi:multisubunit Na+/H+ antiporter MnhB subunit